MIDKVTSIFNIMICINLESHNPFFNLAVDEYLLKNRKEDFLVIGINDTSVIIGKHQIAHRETETGFVTEYNIPVIRRISGGGTVYHDRGNMNYSFIINSESGKQINFRKYTLPVISFLSSVGADAKFEGKNDLIIDGFKISGNAEHVFRNRVLHHGTLLFDADLDLLKGSIRKDTTGYSSRAVVSNPSPAANLKDKLKNIGDVDEFRSVMINWFLKNMKDAELCELSGEEAISTELLAESKYRTWEWNYGYGPEYRFFKTFEISGLPHKCRLLVKDGIIQDCSIEGSDEMATIGKKLTGCRHMVPDLAELLRKEKSSITDNDVFNFF